MSSGSFFDLPAKQRRLDELREQAAAPDLWNDPAKAQSLTRELSRLTDDIERYRKLEANISELLTANELGVESGDADLDREVTEGIADIQADLDDLEIQTMFTGELDDHDALVAIHAGEGGTDAQDWAEMLFRMYLRWAERRGFKVEVREALEGEEAGMKSGAVEIRGPYAYGWLRSEHGVHRLVRLSPFDSAQRRHTSHASVDVIPDFGEDELDIEVPAEDLRIDTFRAGGPGGQYVNTTDSAVRITHLPTGITSSCQSERSQLQNRTVAMKMLKSRLKDLQRQEREKELAGLRGEQMRIGFGSRIRSYTLHPYRLVKDHRTEHESPTPDGVLDGDLDGFMTGYLRWNREAE